MKESPWKYCWVFDHSLITCLLIWTVLHMRPLFSVQIASLLAEWILPLCGQAWSRWALKREWLYFCGECTEHQWNLKSVSGFSPTLIKARFSAAHKTQGKLCAYSYLLQDLVIGSTKFPSQIPLPTEADFFYCFNSVGGWKFWSLLFFLKVKTTRTFFLKIFFLHKFG